jgi:hypothetical protein
MPRPRSARLRLIRWLPTLCLFALVGCGGGSDDDSDDTPAPPARGDLVQKPPARLSSLSVADLVAALGANDARVQLAQITGAPLCRVDVHQLQYHTVGPQGEDTIASGAMMVPAGTDSSCQGDRPVLLYAHGTSSDRAYNIADVTNSDNIEGFLMVAVFAAHGYIVIAPNYAGYDTSTLPYHPYLNADQSSKDMIDALTAARSALPTTFAPTTRAGTKLFVTGYSQGGHVAMATHRALEAANTTVTASAPMSGPYALSAFTDAVFYGNVNLGAPVFATLLINGYQRAYGNVYSAATDVFEARYASGIESLLPSTTRRSDLVSQGLLPAQQLFSSTPPDPAFAPYTPPTTPVDRAPLFALGFGPDNLITNAYRLGYLLDAQANPDGAFPNPTSGQPPATPAHPLRIASKTNDLRNWTPAAPVLLCGGNADPTVFYMNTQLMQAYWATTSAPLTVLDIDSAVTSGDPFGDVKSGFAVAKSLLAASAIAEGATDNGASAVLQDYHAGLVAPFCLSAVRTFFNAR